MATPYNYETPDWKPLESAVRFAQLPLDTCGEFMWMCEEPKGTHSYKHCDTRRYVHLTGTYPMASDVAALLAARTMEGR